MTEQDESDLSVLGQEDSDTFDTPEEGGVEPDSGKAKAAFVRLRQERKAFKDDLGKAQQEMAQLRAQIAAGQTAPQPSDNRSLIAQKRAYRENVRQRAMSSLQGEVFATDDERNWAVLQEMQAITSHDAVMVARENFTAMQAPQVVRSVLSEFDILNDDDKATVRDLVNKLPPDLRVNPDVIRKEVHSYIGQNVQRFAATPEPEDEKKRPAGTTLASGKKTSDGKVRLSETAGAATASGLRGGSPGLRLTETPPSKSKESGGALTAEDVTVMRQQGANPSDPDDIKLFRESQKLAKTKTLGV